MPQFSPDQVSFGDLPGYGMWDVSHGREHIQFVQALAARNPPVLLPDFDLLSFLTSGQARGSMVQSHQSAHALLRSITGVQGIDLSQVDLNSPADFQTWMGIHSDEHAQLRAALGIT